MEHRRRMQIDRVRGKGVLGDGRKRVGHQIAVAQHHSLRAPGGAAGIENARKIVPARHRVRDWRGRCNQRFIAGDAGRRLAFVGMDERKLRERRCESLAGLLECGVDHQQAGAAVLQGVLVLGHGPADIERHNHGSGPAGREIEFEIAAAVEHQDRDPVALGYAKAAQRAGEPADAVAHRGPGQLSLALEYGDAVRIDLKSPPQSLRDVHFAPLALTLLFWRPQ